MTTSTSSATLDHAATPANKNDYLIGYRGYAGLLPLVGLHSMSEAASKGLTVDKSVDRLKRIHWVLKRLHLIFMSHITSEPIYELKMAFSLHAHYCAEHIGGFATRVREMRQPPYGLETSPDTALDILLDEIQHAPDTSHLVYGLYAYAVPALVRALEHVIEDTNRLFDHPTYRICRLTAVEMRDVLEYGEQVVQQLLDRPQLDALASWGALLQELLDAAGDMDGREPRSGRSPERHFSLTPRRFDGVPRRDERFKDVYNMGVNAEALLFDKDVPPFPKTLMLYFKRMREIDVPEMMASILVETPGKPWEYYRDMTRQLWDEARHAMMGELGFVSMGLDWTTVPLNFTWSLGLNTLLSAKERHAVLYTIEQGLMPSKTGKQYEWEVAVAAENPLASMIQDYDWADEILHARIGRDWIVSEIGSQAETIQFGDKAWSRILVDWKKWQRDGLTEHRNWWPDLYRAACEETGMTPDPEILAYDTNYENSRADLKEVVS